MRETREIIGNRIRELRKERGLSIITLALMVDMERSYLGKIEAGKINTSIDKLEKILSGLGLTIFEFFDTFHETRNSEEHELASPLHGDAKR